MFESFHPVPGAKIEDAMNQTRDQVFFVSIWNEAVKVGE